MELDAEVAVLGGFEIQVVPVLVRETLWVTDRGLVKSELLIVINDSIWVKPQILESAVNRLNFVRLILQHVLWHRQDLLFETWKRTIVILNIRHWREELLADFRHQIDVLESVFHNILILFAGLAIGILLKVLAWVYCKVEGLSASPVTSYAILKVNSILTHVSAQKPGYLSFDILRSSIIPRSLFAIDW